MCGRYTIFQIANTDTIEDRFGVTISEDIEPRYNAAPGQHLPVVTNETPETVSQLKWGLVPHWADDPEIGNRLINARAETVDEKNSFREAYRNRRCLVLADGFYEWTETDDGKQPYRVVVNDEPFAMAGLWEQWDPTQATGGAQSDLAAFEEHGKDESESEILETYTIITTEPNTTLERIHDRMPVVLSPDEEERWLTGTDSDLKELLDPFDGEMRAYPVSKAVNNPSNDSPEIITEAEAGA